LWIIAVLAGLAAFIVFILWVSLDMVIQADFDGKPKLRLRFSWLFGLVSRDITGKEKKPAEVKRAPKVRKKRRWADKRVMFRVLRIRGLLSRIKRLVKDVLSCFRFREIAADFRIGLGDPADTGRLFAVLGPASVFLGSSHLHRVRLEPSFSDDAVLQGHSHGVVRLRPIRLIPPFLKFALSPPTVKAAWILMTNKWRRKK
jgi:hypothetical protein